MPYFRDRNLEDQEDPQQAGGTQLSSGGTQAGPDGSPNDPAKPQQTGSHFTNIDTYLKNNNAQSFGQQVGQKVQGSIDQAKGTVDNSVNEVRSQIDAAGQAPTQEQIKSAVDSAGAGTTPDQAKQYQGWTNAQYKGPSGLADNAGAQSRISGGIDKAKAEANAVGSEAGRFSLLDQYFGRPNYSFGEKSLDNLLAQGGGGLGDTKAYQDQAAQLGGYADQQSKAVTAEASKKAGDLDASRLAARQAIGLQDDGSVKGGAIGDFQSQLDTKLKSAQQERANEYSGAKADLSDHYVDQDLLKRLGLTPGADVYNLKLSDYLQQKGFDPTRQTVASKDDYSRYLALTQLAGLDPTYLTPDQQAQAGSYSHENELGFNRAGFDSDVARTQSEYHAAFDAPRDWSENIYSGDPHPSANDLLNWNARNAGNPEAQPQIARNVAAVNKYTAAMQQQYGYNNKLNGLGLPPPPQPGPSAPPSVPESGPVAAPAPRPGGSVDVQPPTPPPVAASLPRGLGSVVQADAPAPEEENRQTSMLNRGILASIRGYR